MNAYLALQNDHRSLNDTRAYLLDSYAALQADYVSLNRTAFANHTINTTQKEVKELKGALKHAHDRLVSKDEKEQRLKKALHHAEHRLTACSNATQQVDSLQQRLPDAEKELDGHKSMARAYEGRLLHISKRLVAHEEDAEELASLKESRARSQRDLALCEEKAKISQATCDKMRSELARLLSLEKSAQDMVV